LDSTIEDIYHKTITVNDQEYIIQIYDTAGLEVYNASVEHRMRDGEAFILVYCNSDRESFARVKAFAQYIGTHMPEAHTVLVENKADQDTAVPEKRGQKLAVDLGVPFFKTSATANTNVKDVFLEAAKAVVDRRQYSCKKSWRLPRLKILHWWFRSKHEAGL